MTHGGGELEPILRSKSSYGEAMTRASWSGRKLATRATVLTVFAVIAALAMGAWPAITRAPDHATPEREQPAVADAAPVMTPIAPLHAAAPPAPIALPEASVVPVSPAPPSKLERAKAAGATVRVKKGETLIDLAADHLGSPDRWRELLEINADKFKAPERLQAGMLIRLPEGIRPATADEIRVSRFRRSIKDLRFDWYVVRAGDTLASIAQETYGDAAKAEWIVNANADALFPAPGATQPLATGQRLRLTKEYLPGTGCGG